MVKPPVPTPEELRQQQQFAEETAHQRFIVLRKQRLWTAIIIGFVLSLIMNSGFAIFGDRWGMISLFIVAGTVWSIIVQFKSINHLVSGIVFGFASMIVLFIVYDPLPPLFWCLSTVINGMLIGIINDLYRSKYLGH